MNFFIETSEYTFKASDIKYFSTKRDTEYQYIFAEVENIGPVEIFYSGHKCSCISTYFLKWLLERSNILLLTETDIFGKKRELEKRFGE